MPFCDGKTTCSTLKQIEDQTLAIYNITGSCNIDENCKSIDCNLTRHIHNVVLNFELKVVLKPCEGSLDLLIKGQGDVLVNETISKTSSHECSFFGLPCMYSVFVEKMNLNQKFFTVTGVNVLYVSVSVHILILSMTYMWFTCYIFAIFVASWKVWRSS